MLGSVGPVTTGTDYASAFKLKVPPQTSKMMVSLKENNTNAIKYKVLVSVDNVTYEEEKSETAVGKNGSASVEIPEAWLYVDIQVKTSVPPNNGKVTVAISGS